ncbi:interferon regulatory factor 5 [Cricetulus griseus]
MVTRAPPGLDTSVGISEQDQKGRGLGSRKSWGPSREDLVAQSPSLLLKLLVQDWEQEPSAMNQPAPGVPPPPRRVRLKPWLVAQVNSCRFPGLQWVNGERKLFYIPWRHATRHGPSQDGDNTIFKAWAKETGKYTEGVDEADPAKWKANLRCALNKSRDFRLIYDGPRDMPPQPYKIYEVCSNGPAPTEPVLPGPPIAPYSLPKEGVKWSPALQSSVGLGPPAPDPNILAHPSGNPAGFGQILPEDLEPGPLASSQPPIEQLLPDLLISPHMLPCKNSGGLGRLAGQSMTDLEIKFQYRGRPPRALTISNPQGCRLFYSQLEATQEQVELFGPVSLEQVRFPSPEDIPSEKQRFYTNQLLDVLDRGLILQLQGQDLYAIRLCQCKVFWSGPCALAQGSHPNPIQREVKTKLFSLEQFLNELILFQKGQTNIPPPFEIFFCFGEEWPDLKPREKKLITVQVVPVAARLLLEMFSGELSWSADSIRLQISNPDLKDHMVEQFKELHHIWQSQQRLQPMVQAPPMAGLGAGQGPWPMHPVGMQ